MQKLIEQLRTDGQVILSDYEQADRLRNEARKLIGQKGFGGLTIRVIRMTAALPAVDGVHGYKVVAL